MKMPVRLRTPHCCHDHDRPADSKITRSGVEFGFIKFRITFVATSTACVSAFLLLVIHWLFSLKFCCSYSVYMHVAIWSWKCCLSIEPFNSTSTTTTNKSYLWHSYQHITFRVAPRMMNAIRAVRTERVKNWNGTWEDSKRMKSMDREFWNRKPEIRGTKTQHSPSLHLRTCWFRNRTPLFPDTDIVHCA